MNKKAQRILVSIGIAVVLTVIISYFFQKNPVKIKFGKEEGTSGDSAK